MVIRSSLLKIIHLCQTYLTGEGATAPKRGGQEVHQDQPILTVTKPSLPIEIVLTLNQPIKESFKRADRATVDLAPVFPPR